MALTGKTILQLLYILQDACWELEKYQKLIHRNRVEHERTVENVLLFSLLVKVTQKRQQQEVLDFN